MIIEEKEMLKMLGNASNILLIEPDYPSKYPPLGLAKVKTFLDNLGIKSTFSRHMRFEKYDLICMTSLFTYYSKQVFQAINSRGIIHHDTPILIGGILASMMPELFEKYKNMFVFKGYSKVLDDYKPDYELLKRNSSFDEYSYVFTSRGCPNKCPYCVVWRIEKEKWVNKRWKETLDISRPNIMFMDNNLSSIEIPHLRDVVDFSIEHDKGVSFQSGFDCKYITPEMSKILANVKYVNNGMRLAFDRIEEDGIFQNAVKMLKDAGISASGAMLAYVLFNFVDTPHEADYRARECANLIVRPYISLYRPLNSMNSKNLFVGKHWSRNLGRAFRSFWLDFFLYKNTTFDEYIHTKECIQKFRLTSKDLLIWETNGGQNVKTTNYFKVKKISSTRNKSTKLLIGKKTFQKRITKCLIAHKAGNIK